MHDQFCDAGPFILRRLKSAGGNKTIAGLQALNCARRMVLTGTPVQNNLEVGSGSKLGCGGASSTQGVSRFPLAC
jgi:hypothetical protein